MEELPHSNGTGGGIFVAIGPLAGFGLGWYLGQPTAGLLIGLAAGIGIAAFMWLTSRHSGGN